MTSDALFEVSGSQRHAERYKVSQLKKKKPHDTNNKNKTFKTRKDEPRYLASDRTLSLISGHAITENIAKMN